MSKWIGRELERVRKLQGLRREDVAARLAVPVSASTIRNIEHDEGYNVSISMLRDIAAVLSLTLNVTLDEGQLPPLEDGNQVEDGGPVEAPRDGLVVTDNEHFIRLIRGRYPECPLSNSQIGRRMWSFAQPRGAELVKGRKQVKRITLTGDIAELRMPTTAARFMVHERDFQSLERFADRLGRAFRDEKGRVLVPLV